MRRAMGFASYLNGQARKYNPENHHHNSDLLILDFIGSLVLIAALVCLLSLIAVQLYIRLGGVI